MAVGLATTLESKDAFAYIAADFNQGGRVSTQDVFETLKYAVGFRDIEAEWKFLDADEDYSGVSRSNTVHQDSVSLEAMSTNLKITMTGILLGYVNDSYTTYLDML